MIRSALHSNSVADSPSSAESKRLTCVTETATSVDSESLGLGPGPGLGTDDRQLYERLLRTVRRICPHWLHSKAEDLSQKAALRILERAQRLPSNHRYQPSYLNKVVFSVVIDEIRFQRRRAHTQISDSRRSNDIEDGNQDTRLSRSTDSPEQNIVDREIAHTIKECLEKLPEDRRLALTLSLQGHSISEASTILGWSYKRTENLICRGRAELRRSLTKKGYTP